MRNPRIFTQRFVGLGFALSILECYDLLVSETHDHQFSETINISGFDLVDQQFTKKGLVATGMGQNLLLPYILGVFTAIH